MPRTVSIEENEIVVIPRRRSMPIELLMETRCHWPCPCGGTVPDAPEECEFRKKQPLAGTYCCDAAICNTECANKTDCPAYLNFKKMIQERKKTDTIEFEMNHPKEEK